MSLSIQKASLWKRFSAFLFDFIITAVVAVGIATLLSLALGYDKHNEKLESYYNEYETRFEAEYGVDFDFMDSDEYQDLTEEEKKPYEAATDAFNEAIKEDDKIMKEYKTIFFLSLVLLSISILCGILVVYFLVPLFFRNGQTLGKKIFGIALVRSNCVKISKFVLFVRSIFGLYTIEVMFPIALLMMIAFGLLGVVGIVTIGLLLLLQVGLLLGTKHRATIHDLLSDTIAVDMATQRIFNTQDEMLEFVKKEKAEEAARKDYI